MIPFLNIVSGIVLLGVITFKTELQSDVKKISQQNSLELLFEQPMSFAEFDDKIFKEKGISGNSIEYDDHYLLNSIHLSQAAINFNLHDSLNNGENDDCCSFLSLLLSELDLPPPYLT